MLLLDEVKRRAGELAPQVRELADALGIKEKKRRLA